MQLPANGNRRATILKVLRLIENPWEQWYGRIDEAPFNHISWPQFDEYDLKQALSEFVVDLVLAHSTLCKDGILFTNEDRDRFIKNARRNITLASEIAGPYVACDGDTIRTAFF